MLILFQVEINGVKELLSQANAELKSKEQQLAAAEAALQVLPEACFFGIVHCDTEH
jgi:hypothetical protein